MAVELNDCRGRRFTIDKSSKFQILPPVTESDFHFMG